MTQSYRILHIAALLLALLCPFGVTAKDSDDDFTVVIDAGHGGKDFGACDNGAKEKDINLGVALQLQSLLKKKMKEAEVVMTRSNDKYLTLQERADVANKAKGDLFISIHTNSVDKSNKNRKTVSGSSVYALGLHKDDNNMKVARRENSVIELESNYEQKYSGFDPSKDESYIIFEMAQKKNLSKSIRFAENVQKEMVAIGRGNRGVHQAGFWVLWATSMPSVLIELDFICNPGAAKYMTSDKGQKEYAEAIFKAIEKYHDSWKATNVRGGKASRAAAEEAGSAAELVNSHESGAEARERVLAGSSRQVSKKKTSGDQASGNFATAKRRRRNGSSKSASDKKSFETSAIPLHSEGERRGTPLAAETVVSAAQPDEDPLSVSADKKKKKKDKKKDKKGKEKKKKEKKKRDKNSHNAKVEKFVTVYKIQILASADLLKQNNPRFCGLSPISTYKENNLYKYFYGESTEKSEIDEMLKDVRKKIPDAFVVSGKKSVAAKN